MDKLIYLVPVMGLIGLLYTFIKFNWVSKQDAGNERMKEISTYIAEGAMAFLRAEWKILGYFVVIVGILLAVMATTNPHGHWLIAGAFVVGAVFSATAGYIGMIGSDRKVEQVFEQLQERGVSKEDLQRVYAPLGLDIGADSPAEIALSVIAEILTVLRKRTGKHLSEPTK